MQAVPVAIIDDPNGQPIISSVHGMVIRGESENADNIARLRRVIATALAWVEREWVQQAEALTNDLRSRDKGELDALPDVIGNLPYEGSVATNRGVSIWFACVLNRKRNNAIHISGWCDQPTNYPYPLVRALSVADRCRVGYPLTIAAVSCGGWLADSSRLPPQSRRVTA